SRLMLSAPRAREFRAGRLVRNRRRPPPGRHGEVRPRRSSRPAARSRQPPWGDSRSDLSSEGSWTHEGFGYRLRAMRKRGTSKSELGARLAWGFGALALA